MASKAKNPLKRTKKRLDTQNPVIDYPYHCYIILISVTATVIVLRTIHIAVSRLCSRCDTEEIDDEIHFLINCSAFIVDRAVKHYLAMFIVL